MKTKTVSQAMAFERSGSLISKSAGKHIERSYDVRSMSTAAILWHVATKHRFGLVCSAFGVYVAFSLFGTLIVGLLESL